MMIKSLVTFIIGALCFACNTEKPKPNILWITIEDISPDLGCYGNKNVHTPVLDKLAAKGYLYTNAFASAPVCAAARSAIITGIYPSSTGSLHMRSHGENKNMSGKLADEFLLFPEVLRQNGYYCVNNAKEDYNLTLNKKIWDESSNKAHWKNRPSKETPFFAVFNLMLTHESRINNKKIHDKETASLAKNLRTDTKNIKIPPYFPDNKTTRELMARHYDNISQMDIKVGEILQQLKEDGLGDTTIIFFYSDHGTGIPRHKRWLFDTGVKVPFIVYVPEKYKNLYKDKPGTAIDKLLIFVDLAPTVLNIAGIPIPEYIQGEAFIGPNLKSEKNYVFVARGRMDERYDMQRAVRSKEYKYIRYYEPTKPYYQYMNTPEKGEIMKEIRKAYQQGTLPYEASLLMGSNKPYESLYHITDDPLEIYDLAKVSKYKEILDEMRTQHKKWMKRIYDVGLIPEPIMRTWESKYKDEIYDIVRNQEVFYDDLLVMSSSRDSSILIKGLRHKSEAVRYWAAQSLGNLDNKLSENNLNYLFSLINDSSLNVSISLSRVLIKQGRTNNSIFNVLKDGLLSKNEWTRLQSALVIDEFILAARTLEKKLEDSKKNDKNKYVVRVANHALNKLNGSSLKVR